MPMLDPHTLRMVAVEAGVNPETVRRILNGKPAYSTTLQRVRSALEKTGHIDQLPAHHKASVTFTPEKVPA